MTTERVTPVRELEGDEHSGPSAGGPPRYFVLAEPAPGVVLAGTCGRGIARSQDGGRTWTVVGELFEGSNVNAFTRGTDGELFAAAGDAGLAVSLDDGATWAPVDCDGASVVCVAATGDGLVAGTTHGVIEGSDGDWLAAASGPTSPVYRLVQLSDGTLAAATERSGVWIRTAGHAWKPIGLAEAPVYALIELDDGHLLAGTRGRGLMRWSGLDDGWRSVAVQPADAVVHTIERRADGSLVAGTGQGVVVADRDGERWTPLGRELANHRMFSVLVRADDTILAGTYDGVWAWSAERDDWEPLDTGLDVGAVFSIAVDHDGIAYAGGRAGAFRSDDRGETWHAIRPPDHTGNVYAFCRSGGDLLIGTDDGLWHAGSGQPGDEWQRAGLDGMRVYTVIEQTPGRLMAGTLGAGVWLRPDADQVWHRCRDGLDHPLAFDLLHSPSTGDVFVATGNLADGFKSGGIYRSPDGERWEPAELEPNTVYDLVETTSGTILAGAQRSRILRSDDGGRSFVTTRPAGRDDSKMYCLNRVADRLYLGAGNELLCSDDAADTWQVVGHGLDGVTVYGVAGCDDGTLLAATSSGVYRSTDAALTWSPAHWNA